jgi:hypothetical protein
MSETSLLSKTQDTVSNISSGVTTVARNYGMTILIAVVTAAILFFIAYMLYIYISRALANKVLWIVPESKVPALGTENTKLSGAGIPTDLNGRRASFMFWIYINDINENKGQYRHILHLGEETVINASPLVMLDKDTNKLYIRYSSIGSDDSVDTTIGKTWTGIIENIKETVEGINNDSEAILYDLVNHGIVVDYVPLQRWVHIAVVINETVNKGGISLYMDGELVKTVSSSESVMFSNGVTKEYSFQNLKLIRPGDVYVGGDNNEGFSGLVSNITFTNYDINASGVYKEYIKGPISNLSSKLGLPAYGVRSPIYRIG